MQGNFNSRSLQIKPRKHTCNLQIRSLLSIYGASSELSMK